MIDVRRLRMLTTLDDRGTVAAVAEELHLSAPAVSMQLAALERELGVDLTERRGRRLALTPAGRVLAAHGRTILTHLSLAELEVDALRSGASGTFRIAAFPSAARTFVADVWGGLLADADGMALRVSTPEPEGALASLMSGEADLAVVHTYSNVARTLPDNAHAHSLGDEPVRIAIRRDDPLAGPVVDLADLAQHAWVLPGQAVTCHEMVERACGIAGFRPRVVAESLDFSALLAFVAAGVGVALVPALTVATLPEGVVLAQTGAPVRRHLHAVQRASTVGDPGLERIIALLRAAATARIQDLAYTP